ncbi:tetratricopeptide repeat protein [Puia dinghuensis]|uniref:Tetratricopeptide repeat protein n=1 Tax=Puia dinghuensis TaxID=1792502 RepID=A0A8J2XWI9_9BACT|nr:hypothetical protein [Puia dinghuensis]GGB24304.1 hypothetical protein GCM10011511_55260 [Puia dinghuensis]
MKKFFLLLIALWLFTRLECRADVKFVDFKKIDPSGQYVSQQHFLLANLVYYDHWSPDWVYDVSKDSLIGELKTCLTLFAPLKANVYETDLLLGEIAHYLYNLNQQSYYDTAEAYYLKAIAADESDCRGYWFLGYHYSQSDELKKGVSCFNKAVKLVNSATANEFWQEYAFAMYAVGMPSHCRYGLDHYLKGGGSSLMATMMDSTLKMKSVRADPDSSYSTNELWQPDRQGKKVTFLSRPLGIKFAADSNWEMQMNGFVKRLTAVAMQPPVVTSPKGANIGFSIALVMHVAGEGEKLTDFMASFMKMGGVRDAAFPFADKFPTGVSYTFQNKNLYSDRGGAHIHFIGIERSAPPYPGMSLEDQGEEMKGEPGKVNFYTPSIIRTRFPGRIFYLFLLDTCEDIHEVSWNTFKEVVNGMKLD